MTTPTVTYLHPTAHPTKENDMPETITQEHIKAYIRKEVASDYKPVKGSRVNVIEDPHVPGCFAARYTSKAYGQIDLLFTTQQVPMSVQEEGPQHVLDYCVEECEFTTWPPTSGPLQFL